MEHDDLTQAVFSFVNENDSYDATNQTENTQDLLTTSELEPYCTYDEEDEREDNTKLFSLVQNDEFSRATTELFRSGVHNKHITPLYYKSGKWENESTEFLLVREADIFSNGSEVPLQLFTDSCDQEIVNKLIFRKINVPEDGSCLFWAATLAFLIPVRCDNSAFQHRFEKLFGDTYSAEQVTKVQKLIQGFDPSVRNAAIRNDKTLRTLVTEKFRNRVVDRISKNRSWFEEFITINDILYSKNENYVVDGALQERFCDEFSAEIADYDIDINKFKPITFNEASLSIIDDELGKIPDQDKVKFLRFRIYVECMRDCRAWGGNHEIQAITKMLRCNINVCSGGIQHAMKDDNSNDEMQLYNNGESHYNFGLIRAPALMKVLKCKREKEAETYVNFGIDYVNYKDSNSWTLLHFAAHHGYLKVIQLLLAQGASTVAKNSLDQTPSDVAAHLQKDYIVRLLNRKSESENSVHLTSTRLSELQQQPNQDEKICVPTKKKLQTYNKRPGTSGISGQLYEMQLLMMILLEAIQRKEDKKLDGFHLAANMEEAGVFDDVVFKYKYRDQDGVQKSKIIFLQAKHKENIKKNKITVDKLLSEAENDFNLRKYFSCYSKIKQQFPQVHHPIFHGKFKEADCDLVVYTNALSAFTESRETIETVNLDQKNILHFQGRSDCNRYFRIIFDEDKNKRVTDVLKCTSDSMKLAKSLALSVFSSSAINFDKGVLKDYYIPLAQDVIQRKEGSKEEGKLRDNFLNNETNEFRDAFLKEVQNANEFKEKSIKELTAKLREKSIILPASFGRKKILKDKYSSSLPNDFVSDDDIKEFLRNFKLFVNQPNESELCEIIKQNIQSAYRVEKADVDRVFSEVKIKVERWWKDGREYLTESNRFFQEAARVSIWFDVRDPVDLFTGREKELAELHEAMRRNLGKDKLTVISQMTSISGLGGVGKSELARRYVHEYAKHYDDNVIWINAESYVSLVESFRRLAQNRLSINTKNIDGREKDIRSIVEEAYNYFSKRRSIFVFDNAEKYKTQDERDAGIDKFLPSLPPGNKPLILITSRNQEWGENTEKLSLDVFTEQEAERFIRKALKIEDGLQGEEVKKLADMLQRFPLALQQAVAYIGEENKKSENTKRSFSINDYIEQYKREETQAKGMLDFEISDSNGYTRTTFITWKITLEKIKQMDYGDEALDIMNIMAYFAPNRISTKIFLSLIDDKRELGSALQLLKQYSMINLEKAEAYVHRLVQQVTRIELKQRKRETDILREALTLLEEFMTEKSSDVGSEHAIHAVSAWNHANGYKELVKEFSELPRNTVIKLAENVRYEDAHAFGEEASNLLCQVLGQEHPDTLTTRSTVALVLDKQGKYDEALCIYQYVLDKFKQVLGTDHPHTLTTMNNRAAILYSQGKYDEALCAYNEVFDKFKLIFGCDHIDTLAVMNNIAFILDIRGSYNEALKAYQEVLGKRKQILGTDNPSTLSTMHNIALLLQNQGKYFESLEVYKEVLSKSHRIFGSRHPFTLSIRNNRAMVISKQGNYQEALNILHNVLDQEKEIFGPDHPDTLSTKHEIATQFHKQGYYRKASKLYQEVLEERKRVLGPDHPSTLSTMHNIALLLEDQGQCNNALKTYREVLEKAKQIWGTNHPSSLNAMEGIGSVLQEQGNYDEALEVYQEVLDKRKQILGSDHPDTLGMMSNIAGIFFRQGKYEEALKANQVLLKKFEHTLGTDHRNTLSVMSSIALALDKQGKYDEAVKTYQAVMGPKERILGPNHPDYLRTKNNLAEALNNQRKYDAALKVFEEVLVKRKLILGLDHTDTLATMVQRASVLCNQGNYDDALKASQEALGKMEKILGPDHPNTLKTLSSIATILDHQGNPDEALIVLQKLIPKFQKIFGNDHPFTLSAINNRATLFAKQGNFNEAFEDYQMVLDKFKQVLEPDHPDTLSTMYNIALVLDDQEKYDEAFKAYEEVLEKRKEVLGLDHPHTLKARERIARVLCKKENYEDAYRAYQEVLEKKKNILGPWHPYTLDTIENIARVFCKQGNYDGAYKAYKEVLDKREIISGPDHTDTLITRENMASVLHKQGKYDDALKLYREVLEKFKQTLGTDHSYTLSVTQSIASLLDEKK